MRDAVLLICGAMAGASAGIAGSAVGVMLYVVLPEIKAQDAVVYRLDKQMDAVVPLVRSHHEQLRELARWPGY